MKKTIIISNECAYKVKTGNVYYCEHLSHSLRYCNWDSSFPIGCPLPNNLEVDLQSYKKEIKKRTKIIMRELLDIHKFLTT